MEGRGYKALKDLVNYALDESIRDWRMFDLEHLSFEGFVEYIGIVIGIDNGRQSVLEQEV